MPRTLRKNVVHFNPEVLIYECELVDNQINIQQPAMTANKQNRWGLLEAIRTGVQYGFVQINNSKYRLFKYEDQFYMLVENKNRDKVPDGQKIQGKLITTNKNQESKNAEIKDDETHKKHKKHKTKITYLDKDDGNTEHDEPVRQAEQHSLEEKHPKISMSPMTYSAILPEFDAVIVPETQPWRDFELI